jgi:hypothetical protein
MPEGSSFGRAGHDPGTEPLEVAMATQPPPMRMMLKLPGAQSDQLHWQAHPRASWSAQVLILAILLFPRATIAPGGRGPAGAARHPTFCRMALDHPFDHPRSFWIRREPSGSTMHPT